MLNSANYDENYDGIVEKFDFINKRVIIDTACKVKIIIKNEDANEIANRLRRGSHNEKMCAVSY